MAALRGDPCSFKGEIKALSFLSLFPAFPLYAHLLLFLLPCFCLRSASSPRTLPSPPGGPWGTDCAREGERAESTPVPPPSTQLWLPGGLFQRGWRGFLGFRRKQKTVDGRLLPPQGGLMGVFLPFQGSKGDPGVTGPTGAAGLPVSLVGLGVFHQTLSPSRSTVKTIPRAWSKKCGAK